jgi:hypothetical protein
MFRLAVSTVAAALLLAAAGCDKKPTTGPNGERYDPKDPVSVARERGRQWAERADPKLISDCGALADINERSGCADYVNENH